MSTINRGEEIVLVPVKRSNKNIKYPETRKWLVRADSEICILTPYEHLQRNEEVTFIMQ